MKKINSFLMMIFVLVLLTVGCTSKEDKPKEIIDLELSEVLEVINLPKAYQDLERVSGDSLDELGVSDNLVFNGVLRSFGGTNTDAPYYTEAILVTDLTSNQVEVIHYRLKKESMPQL